jgi:formate/nitrite transporter FocA (FNT family)
MTRMHNGTDSVPVRLVASIAVAFLLAGLRLFHSVLDSLLLFFALQSGHADYGYLDWLRFFSIAVVGNVAGGVALTSILRLLQSRRRIIEHRLAVDAAAVGGADGPRPSGTPSPADAPQR